MRIRLFSFVSVCFLFSFLLLASGCKKDDKPGPEPSDVWDIDKNGIPRFVSVHYLDPDSIGRISRFRSGFGHDYSDAFEDCRSMKHYFEPRPQTDWGKIRIFSPVKGRITRAEMEWAGMKLEIESSDRPAFRFVIFHISPAAAFQPGDTVSQGRLLGTHIGSQTMSDIAVIVNDPTRQGRMVSWFEVLTDQAFARYQARGVTSRQAFVITRSERDTSPLQCSGETFAGPGAIENWVQLN